MAKQIKNSDLVQPKLWQETVDETNALIKVLGELEKSFKKVSATAGKTAKEANPGSAKGIKDINEATELLKKTSIETDKVRAQIAKAEAQRTKAAVAASKQRASQEEKAANKRQKAATDLIKQRKAADAATKREAAQVIRLTKQKEREAATTAKATAKTLEGNRAYNKASRELNILRKRFKDLAISGKGTKTEMAALLFQITKLDTKIKSVDKSVGQSQRNVGNYKSAFKGLGQGIGSAIGPMVGITAVIAGVTAGIRAATGLFREFGLVSAKVQAVSGATATEFEALQTQAKELGRVTPFTASNVAQLQLELSKLGFTAKEIGVASESILQFAIATDSELGRSAEVVASTLNAFNLEASEAGRIADVAAKAFSSSALDIEKFATAIAIVGPASNATGVSIEKTTAILGKIVDSGIDASTAGSALRNVFIDIADKGITLDEALNQISTSQNKLTTANELFGKRGAVVATVIADNVDEIDALDKSLLNAAGSSKAASDIIGDTLDGDIKKFTSSIQGLILGNSGLAKSIRGIVQGFTRLIRMFSDVEGAQENLIDSNLDQLESSEANIAKNTELADTYKELSSQENLTAEETEILNGVKGQLLSTFDDSIAKINEETGAIEINIEALEQKIAAEVLLSSEAAKSLIGDKARLKIQISLAKNIGLVAKTQLENNSSLADGVPFALLQIKNAEDYNRVLQELRLGKDKGRDQAAKDLTIAAELEKVLGRSSVAAFNLTSNEIELAKIEGKLLDLGIDLNAIARARAASQKGLNNELTKTKDLENTDLKDAELEVEKNFQKNKLQLIEESDKKIRIAKQKEGATDVTRQKDVERIEKDLAQDLNQIEIDRLQDLIEARSALIDGDDLKQIQLKIQLQEKLTEVTIDGLEERSDAEIKALEAHNKELKKLADDHQKALDAKSKKIQESTVAAIDVLDEAFTKASDRRINEIDREITALQSREDALRQAAQNGSELAKDNLATNQRLQAEQERVRDEQVKKAQRREIVLAGIKAFAENAGEPNAVGKTLSDITTLSAALLNLLPGFYDGTEDTGQAGEALDSNGGRLAVLHDNERVMTKKQNSMMGGLSNDDVANIVHDHVSPTHFDHAPMVQVQRFESNAEVLQKFDVLAEKLDNLPNRMPRILDEKFDEKAKVYTTVLKSGNKVEKNHRKIKGIWG